MIVLGGRVQIPKSRKFNFQREEEEEKEEEEEREEEEDDKRSFEYIFPRTWEISNNTICKGHLFLLNVEMKSFQSPDNERD